MTIAEEKLRLEEYRIKMFHDGIESQKEEIAKIEKELKAESRKKIEKKGIARTEKEEKVKSENERKAKEEIKEIKQTIGRFEKLVEKAEKRIKNIKEEIKKEEIGTIEKEQKTQVENEHKMRKSRRKLKQRE